MWGIFFFEMNCQNYANGATTFSRMTLSRTVLKVGQTSHSSNRHSAECRRVKGKLMGAMTLNKMTLSLMTPSKAITTAQQPQMLIVAMHCRLCWVSYNKAHYAERCYVEDCYAKCRYVECRTLRPIMPSVVMQRTVMLSISFLLLCWVSLFWMSKHPGLSNFALKQHKGRRQEPKTEELKRDIAMDREGGVSRS